MLNVWDTKPRDYIEMLEEIESRASDHHAEYDNRGEFIAKPDEFFLKNQKKFRDFAELLTNKVYEGQPKKEINLEIIKNVLHDLLEKDKRRTDDQDSTAYFKNIEDNLQEGSYELPLEYIENAIDSIANLRRDKAFGILKENIGADYMEKLKDLRNYREFLRDKINNSQEIENITENLADEKKQTEEEKLFNQQIENNAHPNAQAITDDVIFYLFTLDDHNAKSEIEDYTSEIEEILRSNDVEYASNGTPKVSEENAILLEPLLGFRQEIDEWDTFTFSRIKNYREKIFKYLEDTFGIEEYNPKEGNKFNNKEQRATKVEKTNNELLDYSIKKATRPGYGINERLYNYAKDYSQNELKEKGKELKEIKDKISKEEFDRKHNEYLEWQKSHSSKKVIKPAVVTIYRYEK